MTDPERMTADELEALGGGGVTNLIEQMNDRNAVLSDLSKKMAETKRLAEIDAHRYYAVYQGACYQCVGEGTIDRDFGAPLACPVCNGTKRWPPEEERQDD